MTDTTPDTIDTPLPDLPGGPYDIEFFFDPGCPFAWQTSVWVRRLIELRDLKVGWRFISLKFINEGGNMPPAYMEATEKGLRYHRICAAAREQFGNDAVARLYRAYGERYWYHTSDLDFAERMAEAAAGVDPREILKSLDLPVELADAADDSSWDAAIRAESDEAFRRTGPDVGTPIITYVESGNSLFGPVISSVPDDETAVAFYDALRVMVDFEGFSELKRTKRPQLTLPLLSN
ncbi:MAG: hypothetical protein U0Q22_06790 [Acidimicrobiales bacterium]